MATRHLSLWLRSDAGVIAASGKSAKNNQAVTTWLDQTAGDNRLADKLAQNILHRRPRFFSQAVQKIGGLPVVRFAGGPYGKADQFLAAADQDELHVTQGYALFALVRFNGKGQRNEVVFLKARKGGNDIGTLGLIRLAADGKIAVGQNINGQWADRVKSSRPVPNGLPVLIVADWNGAKLRLDVFDHTGPFSSDAVTLNGKIDPGGGGRLSIGGYIDAFSDNGERLNGDLGEVLFYRAALSDTDRIRTTNYLRKRWLKSPSVTPLEMFSQALLNLNEFLYIE